MKSPLDGITEALNTLGAELALEQFFLRLIWLPKRRNAREEFKRATEFYSSIREKAAAAVQQYMSADYVLNPDVRSQQGSASEFLYFWGTVLRYAHVGVTDAWHLAKDGDIAFPADVTPSPSASPDYLRELSKLVYALRECLSEECVDLRAEMLEYAQDGVESALGPDCCRGDDGSDDSPGIEFWDMIKRWRTETCA